MALSELARRGAPTGQATVRKRLEVQFADFTPINTEEYRTYFGLTERAGAADRHQVFEAFCGGERYLVPALVLMRALFRPTDKLLPQMFSPSALERNCRLDISDGDVIVVVDAKWAHTAEAQRYCSSEGPLSWMMLHPSARRMADSVHRNAMAGRIALDLPEGSAEVVITGVNAASNTLVTEIRILAVTAADAPDLPVATWAPRIDFVNRSWAESRNLTEALTANVPLHADGGYELTDDEWTAVGPILEGRRKLPRQYQHCQRKMLDGVLGKLVTGKSWRDFPYKVGDWRNASSTYRSWNLRGTLDQALQALRDMR